MKYDPEIHHRRSIRLAGYDYSQSGMYFVTVCAQNRECLFGGVLNGEMVLNDAGIMVRKWFYELENKFTDIKCDEMIVMPNHIHFIVINTGDGISMKNRTFVGTVGADLCVCPYASGEHQGEHIENRGEHIENRGEHRGEHIGSPLRRPGGHLGERAMGRHAMGRHAGLPLQNPPMPGSAVHSVVQWFKTMTTNAYIRGVKNNGWQPFNGKLWQRNYWEHIIRDEKSLGNIRNYIVNNPAKWGEDEYNIEKHG